MSRLVVAATIASVIGGAGCAYAQVPAGQHQGQVMSRQELEQLQKESDQRLQRMRMKPGVPFVHHHYANPKVYPIKGLWVCKDVKEFNPIYGSPTINSRIVARSSGYVAVGGAYIHGFARVLINNTLIGYVPVGEVKPFFDKLDPSLTCEVQGVQANGVVALYMK